MANHVMVIPAVLSYPNFLPRIQFLLWVFILRPFHYAINKDSFHLINFKESGYVVINWVCSKRYISVVDYSRSDNFCNQKSGSLLRNDFLEKVVALPRTNRQRRIRCTNILL